MKNITRILFLVLLGTSLSSQAQTNHFKKLLRQKPSMKTADLIGLQGKKAAFPDSIEQYSFDMNTQSYETSPTYSTYPTYDANGNLTQEIRVYKNLPNQNSKTTYVYDANGAVNELVSYWWNSQTQKWEGQNKSLTYRNDLGADTLNEYYSYDPLLSQWELEFAYGSNLTYNASNLLSTVVTKTYDVQADEWTIEQRIRFYYNGADTLPFEVYADEVDNLGNLQEVIYVNQLTWALGFNGNLNDFEPTVYMVHEWDGANWVKSQYDSSVVVQGNIVANFYSYYDDVDDKFILEGSSVYDFNAHGDQVYELDLDWNNGVADTNVIMIDSFTYGVNGEILEHVSNYVSFWGSRMESKTKDIYYYGNTGLSSKSNATLMVYPNPISSQGVLFIDAKSELNQVQLIGTDGRVVKQWNTELNAGISMEGLNSGLYFLRAIDQSGIVYSGRVQIK